MRKYIALACCLLLSVFSDAQHDFSLKNIVPPSPEAAAFIKQGTYQVGTYTGKPSISIPVYEIKTNDLSVPISLNYDATGIRVNEMASWVGLNWSLDAGGMISQVVVGEPDRLATTIYDVPPRAHEIINNTTYFNYLKSLVDHDVYPSDPDAEPDKFYYSLPNGKSGSFVFDPNRNIVQIPKTSVKIAVIGNMQGFTIVDEQGVTYIFSVAETTQNFNYSASGQYPSASSNPSGSSYKSVKTAYYLSEIVSTDGTDHIYFSYQVENTSTKDDNYTETYGNKYNNGNQFPTLDYHEYRWNASKRVIGIPRITTIQFNGGKIEFLRVSGRQDDASASSRLDQIVVYRKTGGNSFTKVKSYKLVHGYYYSDGAYAQNSGLPNETCDRYRLKLESLVIKDQNDAEISNYGLTYNTTALPPKTSYAQDWWGYSNGASANPTLVPSTIVYNNIFQPLTIGGANRSSNESFMKAGILEKITYPTGGYSVFETEAHKITVPTDIVSQGNSTYAQSQTANNVTVQTFTAPSGIISGTTKLNVTISPHGGNYSPPFAKLKVLSTGQELIFYNTNSTNYFSSSQFYALAPGESYELTASCQNVTDANVFVAIGINYEKEIYNPHLEQIGGLRIKSIKNYSSDNTLANEENYVYGENEDGAGLYVNVAKGAYSFSRNQKWYYAFSLNCSRQNGGMYSAFMGGPLYDPTMIQGSNVVYTDVTKYYGNSLQNSGKTHFNYGTVMEQLPETRPLPSEHILANDKGIIIISDGWKRGQLVRQEDYLRKPDNSFVKVSQIDNTYTKFITDTIFGLFAQLKFDRVVLPGSEICLVKEFTDYDWAEYPINTGYVQLTQTVQQQFSTGSTDVLQTTINHSYDNVKKDIEVLTTTVNSKNQTIETETKFPFHKAQLLTPVTSSESVAIDAMVSRNMLLPVEQITRNGGVQTGLKKTTFDFVNASIIAPVNIKYQLGANPLDTRLKFTKYDAEGNLLEQQKSDDTRQSFIWDYLNSYPVAECLNADQEDIAATSFEAEGKGGWTFSGTMLTDVSAPTGSSVYNLATGAISRNINPAKIFTISYWRPVGQGALTISGNQAGYPVTIRTANGWTCYEHKVSGVSTVSLTGTGSLDELRLFPDGAMMNTYTYTTLIGQNSLCDPNNRITYYEYDAFNRLALIRDHNKNIVKKICYNYAGKAEDCGLPSFGNSAQSGTFTRNNCPPGNTGSLVTYTVPANTYTASSQAAADQLAINDVNANGQTYANTNGTCTESQNCTFTMFSGYSSPYSTATSSNNTVTFNLTFYPTSSAMTQYTLYTVSTISTGCRPASTKTLTINSNGRTFEVTILMSGQIQVRLIAGSAVGLYTTVNLSGSYSKL